jgi:hypothetical protein
MQKRACMYAIETHIVSQLHYKMPLFISVPCSKHSDPLDLNYLATSQPPPGVIQKKCVLQADSKLPNSSIKYHGLHSQRQGEGSRPNCGGKISHCKMGTLSHLSIIVHHQPLILKHLYKAIAWSQNQCPQIQIDRVNSLHSQKVIFLVELAVMKSTEAEWGQELLKSLEHQEWGTLRNSTKKQKMNHCWTCILLKSH